MSGEVVSLSRSLPAAQRRQIAPNGVIGMLIFVMAEIMFFAGLISAFTIVKSASLDVWPPPGQARLPVEATAFNTLALLLSAVAMFLSNRAFGRDHGRAKRWLLTSMLLGCFFVVFQGFEWASLIGEGLTMTSSTHGAFFYLIVGIHALHAVCALGIIAYVYGRLSRRDLPGSTYWTAQILWYFVVLVWPVLYWRVYL